MRSKALQNIALYSSCVKSGKSQWSNWRGERKSFVSWWNQSADRLV